MTAVVNQARYCARLVLEHFTESALPYSFALQKNSSFTPFFTKSILEMKTQGRIEPLRKKWYYTSDRCSGMDAKAEQFDWQYAFSLVLLLLGTTVFCCFILFGENVIARLRRYSGSSVHVK